MKNADHDGAELSYFHRCVPDMFCALAAAIFNTRGHAGVRDEIFSRLQNRYKAMG